MTHVPLSEPAGALSAVAAPAERGREPSSSPREEAPGPATSQTATLAALAWGMLFDAIATGILIATVMLFALAGSAALAVALIDLAPFSRDGGTR